MTPGKKFFVLSILLVIFLGGSVFVFGFDVKDELGDANIRVALIDEVVRINVSVRCAVEVPDPSGREVIYSDLSVLDGTVVVLRSFWKWNVLGEANSVLSWGYYYYTREWFGDVVFTYHNPFAVGQIEQMRQMTPEPLRSLLFLPEGSFRDRFWIEFWDPAVRRVAGHQVDKLFGCVAIESQKIGLPFLDQDGKWGYELVMEAEDLDVVPVGSVKLPRVRSTMIPPPHKSARSYL